MLTNSSALLIGLAFLAGEPGKKTPLPMSYVGPFSTYRQAKVLDLIEDDRVLISFGANEGARKGMMMDVRRSKGYFAHIGQIELVEIGAKHSIGRFRGQETPREDDVVWLKWDAWPSPPPLLPPLPAWQRPGGAILDPEGLLRQK